MDIPPLILLVDDEDAIRRLCNRMLTRLGYRLLEADSGATARDLFRDHGPDIRAVLLDMNLPDAKGEDLAAEFAAEQPGLPLISFTGGGTDAGEGPIRHSLKKPFTKDTLQQVLKDAGLSGEGA